MTRVVRALQIPKVCRYTLVSHFLVKVESLRIQISRPVKAFLNQSKHGFDFAIISWAVHHDLGTPVTIWMLFAPSGANHIVDSIARETEMNTRIKHTMNVDRLQLLVGRCE